MNVGELKRELKKYNDNVEVSIPYHQWGCEDIKPLEDFLEGVNPDNNPTREITSITLA